MMDQDDSQIAKFEVSYQMLTNHQVKLQWSKNGNLQIPIQKVIMPQLHRPRKISTPPADLESGE